MTEEVERQRLAEWKAHLLSLTGDANMLIADLQHNSPEIWQSYRNTVEQQGMIEPETFDNRLTALEWKSGTNMRIVDVVAPFGGEAEMRGQLRRI